MKLLLDQGLPRRAASLLREAGVDAIHTPETGLGSADDRDIIAWCRANGAVAVALDANFHALIALSGEATPSTVRIRIEGLKGPEVARIISSVIETRGGALDAGALVTVQPGRLRGAAPADRAKVPVNPLVNAISGRLSLRPPQRTALEVLARAVELAPPAKGAEAGAALAAIRGEFPSLASFAVMESLLQPTAERVPAHPGAVFPDPRERAVAAATLEAIREFERLPASRHLPAARYPAAARRAGHRAPDACAGRPARHL